MDRRAFLATTALAASAGGVAAPGGPRRGAPATDVPTPRTADVDLPVPESALLAVMHGVIPAVVEPAFGADWAGVEIDVGSTTYRPRLRSASPVVGVERAYPLSVLERHEVVNDAFPAGARTSRTPLLVTFCPSCGSAMTAVRRVGGAETTFEVSHRIWRSNLVLRDEATRSLWSQLLATAIRGPATGDRLRLVPLSVSIWASWRADHPDTAVLLPPPLSGTRYGHHAPTYAYDRFAASASVGGDDGTETGRTLVIGVRQRGEARAYPYPAVARTGVVNDVGGGVPVVVAVAPGGTLAAYVRRVDGETLRFRRAADGTVRGGGSRWRLGPAVATDGPHAGVQLLRANALPPLFRFAWVEFNPDTTVYGEAR